MTAKMNKKTSDAKRILTKMIGQDKKLKKLISKETLNAQIALEIYAKRTKARLTQRQLAEKIGTTQSVIARLEDANYQGHSLTMLQKIAEALNQKIAFSMKPEKQAA